MIIVTGTPGTGKTTFAKKLAAEKGYAYIDLGEFAIQEGLVIEKDKKRDTLVIDEDELIKRIVEGFERDSKVVIDGHFSQDIPALLVEKCYVTKARLPVLRERLKARKYSEQKILENLECEIFDICQEEAKEKGHDIEIIWT
jgi:adenylate kinase